ncbi:hypothetical protein BDC45DRAFT_541621 [Circinella umbellata]|nr:hypothetical protein BDC45DRAFT_541621 [Circinella umbellata]
MIELAITRFERIMQEQHQLHKKEIKTLKKAINQQTMFSVKLDDLLEQLDQTEQPVNLPLLESAQKGSRFEHVQEIAQEVVARCKAKHSINQEVKWKVGKDLYQYEMYRQLERDARPYLPLKACTAHWGARMLLEKHWQNVEQGQSRANNKARISSSNQTSADQDDARYSQSSTCNEGDFRTQPRLTSAEVEMEAGLMDDYVEHNLSSQENGAVETRNKYNKEGESDSNNDNGNTRDSNSYSISDNTNETDSSSNSGSSDGSSDSDKVMQTQKKAARVTRATQETRTILVMTSPLVTNIKERTKVYDLTTLQALGK